MSQSSAVVSSGIFAIKRLSKVIVGFLVAVANKDSLTGRALLIILTLLDIFFYATNKQQSRAEQITQHMVQHLCKKMPNYVIL